MTPVFRVLALLISIAAPFGSVQASVRCEEIFQQDGAASQRSHWEAVFNRIASTMQHGKKLSTGLIPKENLGQSSIQDSRMFRMHEILGPGSVSVNLKEKSESIQNQFEYIDSHLFNYSHWLGTQNPFHTFRSNKTGKIFSIQLPKNWELSKTEMVFGQTFLDYLKSQELLAQSDHIDHELDHFFTLLKARMAYQWSKTNNVIKDYVKFRYWSGEPQHEGRVEKYVVDKNPRGANLKWGMDDDFVKVATRELIEKEKFFIEIIDTHTEDRRLENQQPSDQQVKEGQDKRREWLNSIMIFVLPDYMERRGWSKEFVKHIYQSTIEAADHTRYVSIRAKNPDNTPGDVLATLGLNRASYGTARFFNKATKTWELHTGPYGSSYNEDFGQAMPEKQHFDTTAWEAPVPLLGMEEYLDIRLPRPSVIDEISGPNSEENFNLPHYPPERQRDPSVDPDLHQPIYFGSGEIYEPVRFWVDPNSELRGAAYSELVPAILKSLFPRHRGVSFGATAQHLYTYNPRREGLLLYGRQGFQPMQQVEPKTLDGTTWHVMHASPATFAKKINSGGAGLNNDEARQFVQSLRENIDEWVLRENSARSGDHH